jgi:hypothetical protein
MTLQGKGKKNETLELHTGPIQSHAEDTSANHTPSREEIRFRAYEIYLERGGRSAMSLMIGCKPNANLGVRRRQRQADFPFRKRLNETS